MIRYLAALREAAMKLRVAARLARRWEICIVTVASEQAQIPKRVNSGSV
jgi:hypothetical protein